MNLTDLIAAAQGGDGFNAAARRFGLDPAQTQEIARAVMPALSSGLKRKMRDPAGAGDLARRMRDTDAEAVYAAPETHMAEADVKGADFLDALFGGARADVESAVAQRASERSGVAPGLAQSMLPALAAMVLGGLQNRESTDSSVSSMIGALTGGGDGAAGDGPSGGGLGGLLGGVGGLFGGAGQADAASAAGGLDLGALTAMFDADGDGSAADDLLEQFMGKG